MNALLALFLAAPLAYPPAPRGNVVDHYAGHEVPAPYRWMEDLDSPAVKQWVEAEDALTFSYLKTIPERDRIRERILIIERMIQGPFLLAHGFSILDIYAAMFTRWSLEPDWKLANLPKLTALAEAVSQRSAIAPVWQRHFKES